MSFQWTDDLSIGVEAIDADHRTLVGMIGDLQDAIENNRGDAIIGEILVRLTDYVGSHLEREEQVMRAVGYPGLTEHHRLHDELMREMSGLVYEYETNNLKTTEHTLAFMKTWLMTHMMTEDRKIGTYLRARGEAWPLIRKAG